MLRKIFKPAPTPYEYGLLSQLAYADNPERDEEYYSSLLYLTKKGWERIEHIEKEDYHAHLWVNQSRKQVVIAHRGSLNATSWVTDLESVVQLKPGNFVTLAIDTLRHPQVKHYREQGFRLSTTGHSLGGFLAQLCVFWAQREESQDTYFPAMSGVVFDSPGVVDFLRVISPNLISQQSRIRLDQLPIHNFCLQPTIVSTFGTQTGTLWHLTGQRDITFDFIGAHLLSGILKEFDPLTGQPKHFRQMIDWPQADYSAYLSVDKAIDSLATTIVKLPFHCLNALYKSVKGWAGYSRGDTWYDQVFKSQAGQVSVFRKMTADEKYSPSAETITQELNLAIQGHYAAHAREAPSKKRVDIHHFEPELRDILKNLDWVKTIDLGSANVLRKDLGWNNKLISQYGEEGAKLLSQFTLVQQGEKTEVEVKETFVGSIFDFQQAIGHLFWDKPYTSVQDFVLQHIASLKAQLGTTSSTANIYLRSAIAAVERTNSLRMVGTEDYLPERIDEVVQVATELRAQGIKDVNIYQSSAVAMHPGATALVIPTSGTIDPSAIQAMQAALSIFSHSAQIGGQTGAPTPSAPSPSSGSTPEKKQ